MITGVARAVEETERRECDRRVRSIAVREVEVDRVVESPLLYEWSGPREGAPGRLISPRSRAPLGVGTRIVVGEKALLAVSVIHERQADLLQVVGALDSACRFTRRLNGRKQQGNQDRNDRDHNQEFNERETTPPGRIIVSSHLGACGRGRASGWDFRLTQKSTRGLDQRRVDA